MSNATKRLALLVCAVLLASCRGDVVQQSCVSAGTFRFAAQAYRDNQGNSARSKLITSQGEYHVYGLPYGDWNTPVERCLTTMGHMVVVVNKAVYMVWD